MSVTVQQAARTLLSYIGVTQFTPQPAGSQLESCQPGDLDNVALALTQALHEVHEVSPIANREVSTGAMLYGPAAVTLDVTQGSTTIANLTGYAARMNGGTIRIGGDDQDNELASQTQLARPYNGPTATGVAATIYGDSVTLPSNYSRAIGPLWLPNQFPMPIADSLEEFLRLSGWPMVVSPDGRGDLSPLFSFIRKSVGRPRVALALGAYDGTLDYVPRRLRVAPLPDQNYTLAFRAAANPPRFTRADIVSPLTTLTVSGSGGDADQSYTYLCDINGYRAFLGVTRPGYAIFYAPWASAYVLASSLTGLSAAPASYWQSGAVTSPLGGYSNEGSATGTVSVMTSDSGGGAGDPGTVIPIVDAAVELILIPMALWRFTSTPSFRNSEAKPGIEKQYRIALDKLKNSRALTAPRQVTYY
ncbi:hypothetical protein CfE428DRAFT_5545 [Chthoniobacter flavus Ellin428]|uniref:Uncharacterized protein n=1 Tax=Chthoniobacter flavus Ellin428 TaxID=497964 RepID=B4D9F5_9BACT|nr:hypothetical protein [Chthoniobacter flavus]EDY16916.1 hypothetical protein CfE428DRAFT_5545 [Chthoniobacter flavus Ellin428]TCO87797.1 hypothetical protein EV701_12096 [Chthoniobacter flavus]